MGKYLTQIRVFDNCLCNLGGQIFLWARVEYYRALECLLRQGNIYKLISRFLDHSGDVAER